MSTDEAPAALLAVSPDEDVAERLRYGAWHRASRPRRPPQVGDKEMAWPFAGWSSIVGATAPQVLIFEDIHWAEPALLDLIEYLVTWTRDAPLLVICPSRPELLDTRPAWGTGRMEASRIHLEPLTEEESRSMLVGAADGGRPAGGPSPAGARPRRGQPAVRRGSGPDADRGGQRRVARRHWRQSRRRRTCASRTASRR